MPSDRLQVTRLFSASRQEIFDAWTDPDAVRQWMCPEAMSVAHVELDVRVGGGFHIDMQRGDHVIIHTGTYHEIVPPEKLVFTWSSENTDNRQTLVTVELFERGDQTELILTHVQLPDEAVEGHTAGWTAIMAHLASYLKEKAL